MLNKWGLKKTQSIIHVEKLTKRYRKTEKAAVNNISFDVQPGEFFAFLGPNGAGKTTTISILTTTLAKTSGNITIAGYDVSTQAKNVRENVGIIFQNPSLDLNLSAEENIRLHVNLYGVYSYKPFFRLMPKEYQNQVLEMAGFMGIREDLFKPLKTFSGGMKRKLEIIRGLMAKPKVLFLDEPSQGLDAVSRRDLWIYLRNVAKNQNTTIFLTTHYIEEAENADRVCIVNHGQIIFLGTPSEMKNRLLGKYLVLDAENRNMLHSQIANFKSETTVDGKAKIYFEEQTPQKILAQIKMPLTCMELHTPTLEEAYMDLIENKTSEATVQ